MDHELNLAFIGGGNMATALASGLIGKLCGAHNLHVIDLNQDTLATWQAMGASVAQKPDTQLAKHQVWVFCVKPQHLKEAALACRPYLEADTLIISVAAGVAAGTLAQWLGTPDTPWTRLVRSMPNTPALIGAGATGLMALPGVSAEDKVLAQRILRSVGQVVWVNDDAQIDAVTALSGSGPAYVFLFLEALIKGGTTLGLSSEQAHELALATVEGATQLARLSPDDLATLRQRVTSKGGTTAAALVQFEQSDFSGVIEAAMRAAYTRAAQLSNELR